MTFNKCSRKVDSCTDLYGCVGPTFDFVAGINQCLHSCGVNLGPDKIYINGMFECRVQRTYTPEKSRITARSFGFAMFTA